MIALLATLANAAPVDVSAELEALRSASGAPGIVGLSLQGGEVRKIGVSGLREAGGTELLHLDDAVHLGSCTKAMTATLVARLVEAGRLAWDTPLSELLPTVAIHEELRDATLVTLLSHRAGLRDKALLADAQQGRRHATEALLSRPPRFDPDEDYRYSNAGYVVVGSIVEETTGQRWEALMQQEVFGPLGMTSCGFGVPPDARGHKGQGRVPVQLDNPPALGPAATVHCNIEDWGRFAAVHAARDPGYLSEASWRELQQPVAHDYALGWNVQRAADGATVLTHDGSNTYWHSAIYVRPRDGVAMLAVVNAAGDRAAEATHAALKLLAVRPE